MPSLFIYYEDLKIMKTSQGGIAKCQPNKKIHEFQRGSAVCQCGHLQSRPKDIKVEEVVKPKVDKPEAKTRTWHR